MHKDKFKYSPVYNTATMPVHATRQAFLWPVMTVSFLICLTMLMGILFILSGLFAYRMIDNPIKFSGLASITSFATLIIVYWQVKSRSAKHLLNELVTRWKSATHLPGAPQPEIRSFKALCRELRQLTDNAIETHRMQMQLKMRLESQQKKLGEYEAHVPFKSELKGMFEQVRAYSQMLEYSVAKNRTDPDLREAFDELSEHCVNLQLLTRGLDVLQQRRIFENANMHTNPASAMSGLLLSLSTALERRNMSLSTLAWDEKVTAKIDPSLLELVMWLVLLGAIRYAEDESTLNLSCEPDYTTGCTYITCLITELAPLSMLAEERLAFMEEKSKYQNAHMFAHTLAGNTNYILANKLAAKAGATLNVHPLTQTSCLVELVLPA